MNKSTQVIPLEAWSEVEAEYRRLLGEFRADLHHAWSRWRRATATIAIYSPAFRSRLIGAQEGEPIVLDPAEMPGCGVAPVETLVVLLEHLEQVIAVVRAAQSEDAA